MQHKLFAGRPTKRHKWKVEHVCACRPCHMEFTSQGQFLPTFHIFSPVSRIQNLQIGSSTYSAYNHLNHCYYCNQACSHRWQHHHALLPFYRRIINSGGQMALVECVLTQWQHPHYNVKRLSWRCSISFCCALIASALFLQRPNVAATT